MIHRAHQVDEFVVDDAHDLLAGVQRAEHGLADGPLGDALNEVVGDGEVDVGVQQGAADFLQTVANIGFGQAAAAAQLLQRLAEAFLDALEHDTANLLTSLSPRDRT